MQWAPFIATNFLRLIIAFSKVLDNSQTCENRKYSSTSKLAYTLDCIFSTSAGIFKKLNILLPKILSYNFSWIR